MTRRKLVKLICSLPALLAIPSVAIAKAAKKAIPKNLVSEKDPMAMAMNYKHIAKQAERRKPTDAKKFCDNCTSRWNKCAVGDTACKKVKNPDTAEYAPCDMFKGKVVAAKGWCQAWAGTVK